MQIRVIASSDYRQALNWPMVNENHVGRANDINFTRLVAVFSQYWDRLNSYLRVAAICLRQILVHAGLRLGIKPK